MGRQIQIYFSPNDVQAYEEAAKRELGASVLAHRHPASRVDLVFSTTSKSDTGTRSFGYLVRPEDVAEVVLRYVPAQGYWVVDETRSPVVEFDGGFDNGKVLRRGRLYFQQGFYGAEGQWIEKPRAFLHWAERLLNLAKHLSRRDSKLDAYLGHEALKQQSAGWDLAAP